MLEGHATRRMRDKPRLASTACVMRHNGRRDGTHKSQSGVHLCVGISLLFYEGVAD